MKYLKGFLLFLAILLLVSVAAVYLLLRSSLPKLSGTVALPALSKPVDVLFDSYGTPHVYAASERDLMRATGYLHAQERMWQMDLIRRAINGRLSEIFGERTVEVDRMFRTLGLWHAAEADEARIDPSLRQLLDAYVGGVNDYIGALGTFRPPEFLAMRYRPEPWTIRDSLGVIKLMAFRLSGNMRVELVREKLLRVFGPERTAELFGEDPPGTPSIIEAGDIAAPAKPAPVKKRTAPSRVASSFSWPEFPSELAFLNTASKAGSNSFVVAGSRSVTGRPFLANDPHLAVEMPGIWYEMHLVGGAIDATGVTLPGLPLVVIGHNERIAWGLTNLGGDCQDLYREKVDPQNPRRYQIGERWFDMKEDRLAIGVRGAAPVPLVSRWTIHGPVITPGVAKDIETLSMAWTAYFGGRTVSAFYRVDQARDFQSFRAALADFDAPSQNAIYADVSGNIGYVSTGTIPFRRAHDGLEPAPGWEPATQWEGFFDTATRPSLYNPEKGYVVTANNRVSADPRWEFAREYEACFRAARIVKLVQARERHDAASLGAIQMDVHSMESELYRPYWEGLRPHVRGSASRAVEMLLAWNGDLDSAPAASLYEAFRMRLLEDTLKDDLGDVYKEFIGVMLERANGPLALLAHPDSAWWDDRSTPAVERRDEILERSLAEAWDELSRRLGSPEKWRWAREHQLRFAHILGAARAMSPLFNRGPFELPGDGETADNFDFSYSRPYEVTAIASWRVILDTSNWDASVSILPTGESGHPLSTHYTDQTSKYLSGGYKPMPFTRGAVEKATRSRLRFVPATSRR